MEEVKDLSGKSYFRKDFSGMDLKGVPMHHSRFNLCKFVDADISGNDCSYSDFSGSDMSDVRANGTNFAHSILACRFFLRDAYGITITLECRTFQGMLVSRLLWMAWVYFALIMIPDRDNDGTNLNDLLIKALGADRYIKLKKIFEARLL